MVTHRPRSTPWRRGEAGQVDRSIDFRQILQGNLKSFFMMESRKGFSRLGYRLPNRDAQGEETPIGDACLSGMLKKQKQRPGGLHGLEGRRRCGRPRSWLLCTRSVQSPPPNSYYWSRARSVLQHHDAARHGIRREDGTGWQIGTKRRT